MYEKDLALNNQQLLMCQEKKQLFNAKHILLEDQ